jgi:dephospho-CoA kinase
VQDFAGVSFLLGLSGGIGSGKSTVAQMLAARGASVIDADAIVHELQAPGKPMVDELAEAFGPGILDTSGALDRAALGALVFRDEEARKRLNAIVHPQVGAEFARRLQTATERGDALVVLDIPLLFEGRKAGKPGSSSLPFDATVLVYVDIETQIERTMARDGCTREAAQARIDAQMPLAEKRPLADHVIVNDGTLEQTEKQVDALLGLLGVFSEARP